MSGSNSWEAGPYPWKCRTDPTLPVSSSRISLVDWRVALCLHSRQLHRSPGAQRAGTLKAEYHWSNFDFAIIVTAFRILICGRAACRRPPGRRDGYAARSRSCGSVVFGDGHADIIGNRLGSFCTFRFLLGAGEAANWPGRPKPSPNGSRPRSVPSPWRCSTAAPQSEVQSRRARGVALSRVRHLASRVSDHRRARFSLATLYGWRCITGRKIIRISAIRNVT